MKRPSGWMLASLVIVAWTTVSPDRTTADQPAGADDRVAALKQSLQESRANLRKYEWIETTIVSLKGEEKSRKQQRCYYGADGKLQKLPIASAPAPPAAQGGGRRGARVKQRIVENKKEDMLDYMEQAAALVHAYVPPEAADIERAKQNGKLMVRPGEGGRARLEFTDYLKSGDRLAVDLDTAANRLVGLNVASYLDSPGDAVALAVRFGTLADSTSYIAETTFEAKAKNVRVTIQNAGHKVMPQ